MSHLIGLDLGTSSIKALLVQDNGQIVGQGSAEYPIHTPKPGMAEQDPAEWWQATVSAVRQALDSANSSVAIAAIGLSGQMHGTVLLDGQNQALAPAIIWPDQRTERQVREITALVGAESLIDLTGSPVSTGFQAATVRWVQQEQPVLWRRVHKVLLPKDYLRWRLTGRLNSDPSDGSGTLLLDVHRRDWSPELLSALEVEPDKLPPIQPSTAVAGELEPDAAEALGLPSGIPVVTGAADTPCSLLGAGVITPERLLLTLSTGGQLVLPAFEMQVNHGGRIHTFCSALEPLTKQAS
jgi:xylulokinase